MSSSSKHLADDCECLEVSSFAGHQRISLEMRDDLRQQTGQVSHLVLECLVAPVWPEPATPKVLANGYQNFGAVSVLTHRETGSHLPSHPQLVARREGDGETAFSIDVSRYIRRDVHQSCRRVGCIDVPKSYNGPFSN